MELPDNPKTIAKEERRIIRLTRENERFSIDHYMADFMDDEMIQEILKFKLNWDNLDLSNPNPKASDAQSANSTPSALSIPTENNQSSIFTDKEKDILRNLPNKEYLLSKEEQRVLLLNLLDILLSFTYDLRTTFGTHTVESGWTITRVSSVLSSCDVCFIIFFHFSFL